MRWVAAAILAGAGIWVGATLAFFTAGTEWNWIALAIAVQAIIVAGATALPVGRETRSKMLLAAAAAIVVTAVAIAVLLARRWCVGYSWTGGPPYDCSDLTVWGRIFVAGVGFVVGLILVSFARAKANEGHRTDGFAEGPRRSRDQGPSGKSGA
jgi:hypothetical protein